MNFSYENLEKTLVENTTMKTMFRNGVPYQYLITPKENYVLHEIGYDYTDMNNLEIKHKGYTVGTITVPVNYDFETNDREIYAVVESEEISK